MGRWLESLSRSADHRSACADIRDRQGVAGWESRVVGVQMSHPRITILGVAIDNITEDEAIDRIAGFIAEGGPHHVVTVNPEFVMEARHNHEFRRVLAEADMATPDE